MTIARLVLGSLLLAGLPACGSGPRSQDPLATLALAEAQLARGEAAAAAELLLSVEEEDFVDDDRARYLLLTARALARSGDLWDGFEIIRDFADSHTFSPYAGEVQDLEYEIGSALIQSSGGFLFFTSDKKDGRIVLEHFTLRYPQHPATPDALRLLGEKAYSEGEYALARERFRELVLKHENSEWVPLARFRIAMSTYRSLVGPRYDLRSLRRAHNELRDFLAVRVEHPGFRQEATDALAVVRSWLGQKHVLIADFYQELGNGTGERYHLAAAASGYPETEAGQEAKSRLDRMVPPPAPGGPR